MSLPSGYKRLEYIQSSGTQYIDTGFKPNQDTRVVTKISFNVLTSGTSSYAFGAANSGSSGMFEVSTGNNLIRLGYGGTAVTQTFPSTKPFTIDFNKNVVTINGNAYALTAATFTGTYSMYICDTNRGKAYRAIPTVTVYSFQIYDNGTLVRDFIPCKNASGVVGMWDDVNSTFYGNAGSGTFTAGPETIGSNRVLVDAKGYAANSGTVLINGMVYHLKKSRGLLNGMGYDIPFDSGTPISDLAVGSTVRISVNGALRDFIIIHHGKPSFLYDDSCNDTWLMMKDIYENHVWSTRGNNYAGSTIHDYLNSTFLDLFESNIQEKIKQVKIPYGTGGYTVISGTNGLSTKIFLLSGYEIGFGGANDFPQDGARLDYFNQNTGADSKRIAYLNGSAATWWLRSPHASATNQVWVVTSGGGNGYWYASQSFGIRPAFVLPTDTLVRSDGIIS